MQTLSVRGVLMPGLWIIMVADMAQKCVLTRIVRDQNNTWWSSRAARGCKGGAPAREPKCAQARNFAQGSALPKRDIVDTTFHASAAARPSATSRSALPTTWGESRKVKDERRKLSTSEAEYVSNSMLSRR